MPRLFRSVFCIVPVALLLTSPVVAQEGGGLMSAASAAPLRGLHTADDMRDWEAVGRLDTGISFCTGTLIAPDLVLTAAHCLFTAEGQRLADRDLTFSAGLRHGRAEAIRQVARSNIPAGYARPLDAPDLAAVAQDVAILHLDRPVSVAMVEPIGLGTPAAMFSPVTLVSYGADREAFPSIEENCRILSTSGAVQVLSCQVVSGSSGAPVLRVGPDGPEVVAIVSGRSDSAGGDVTVAVAAEPIVPDLMATPAATNAASGLRTSQAGAITIRRVGDDDLSRGGIGARFLRP